MDDLLCPSSWKSNSSLDCVLVAANLIAAKRMPSSAMAVLSKASSVLNTAMAVFLRWAASVHLFSAVDPESSITKSTSAL